MPLGLGSLVNGVWKYGENDATGPLFSDFLNKLGDSIRTQIVPAKLGDTGWINLTLINGWAPAFSAEVPQYRRLNGIVYFRGMPSGGTQPSVAAIPAGFRPASPLRSTAKVGSTFTATAVTALGITDTGTVTTVVGQVPNLTDMPSYPADL